MFAAGSVADGGTEIAQAILLTGVHHISDIPHIFSPSHLLNGIRHVPDIISRSQLGGNVQDYLFSVIGSSLRTIRNPRTSQSAPELES
jgi:hypothetical protein